MIVYGSTAECVRVSYECNDYETVDISITTPTGLSDVPVMLYLGLSGFYSGYLGIRSSYSAIQIQEVPRSASHIPYSGCSGLSSLSEVTGVSNIYLPIDAMATDKNWRTTFDLTEVSTLTLRPCGALYYWIPTDEFQLFSTTGTKDEISQSTADLSWDDLDIPSEPSGQTFPYKDSVTNEFVWADPSTQRFRAWRRANVGSEFLVKSGEFPNGIPAGTYTLTVSNCRAVDADKFVDLCTSTWIGTRQTFLAVVFFVCGGILSIAVVVFLALSNNRPHSP